MTLPRGSFVSRNLFIKNVEIYTGGIPFALKLGAFNENMYFFGGGEVEFPIHFKEKYWNAHSRSGPKTKYSKWFGSQTQSVMPSVIAGAQFPGGINSAKKRQAVKPVFFLL